MNLLKRMDPLIVFILVGSLLTWGVHAFGLAKGNDSVIMIDQQVLSDYLASQMNESADSLAELTQEEQQQLADRYIRDEALFREAKKLGLDQMDGAIRSRLIQSLKFSLAGNDKAAVGYPLTEEELQDYWTKNSQRYTSSARVSLSHIFFDVARHGKDVAYQMASQSLTDERIQNWLALGDRYPYQRVFNDVTEDVLAGEWDAEAAAQVFHNAEETGRWFGPVESRWGFHLIRIDRKLDSRAPVYEEIRPQLVKALLNEKREAAREQAVNEIVSRYSVRSDYSVKTEHVEKIKHVVKTGHVVKTEYAVKSEAAQ